MGHEIGFHKTRLEILPIGEGPDRNLVFEQSAGPCPPPASLASLAHLIEQSVDCGRADPQELLSHGVSQAEMAKPFQHGDELRQKGDESFGAEAVGGLPDHDQRLLDRLCVVALAARRFSGCALRALGSLLQERDRVLAVVIGGGNKFVEDAWFVLASGGPVAWTDTAQ